MENSEVDWERHYSGLRAKPKVEDDSKDTSEDNESEEERLSRLGEEEITEYRESEYKRETIVLLFSLVTFFVALIFPAIIALALMPTRFIVFMLFVTWTQFSNPILSGRFIEVVLEFGRKWYFVLLPIHTAMYLGADKFGVFSSVTTGVGVSILLTFYALLIVLVIKLVKARRAKTTFYEYCFYVQPYSGEPRSGLFVWPLYLVTAFICFAPIITSINLIG